MTHKELQHSLDDLSEKIWRQKNLLVVNLPESYSRSIHDRKLDDLEAIKPLFRNFVKFDDHDIDGLPVRIGVVSSDKPRLLRVTFRSETKVKELVYRSREQTHLINPNEIDNRKKIYFNRDYTINDREQRKEKLETKKELEAQGKQVEIRGRQMLVTEPNGRKYEYDYATAAADKRGNAHNSKIPSTKNVNSNQNAGNQNTDINIKYHEPTPKINEETEGRSILNRPMQSHENIRPYQDPRSEYHGQNYDNSQRKEMDNINRFLEIVTEERIITTMAMIVDEGGMNLAEIEIIIIINKGNLYCA